MKKFSLILPIRKRSSLLRRLFDSIIETTSNLNLLDIVLCMDEDDVESREISHGSLAIKKLSARWQGMGDIYRACYNEVSSQYLMLINDDLIFRTKNWDIKVLEALSYFPDDLAVVYANDLYYGDKLCSFPVMSRKTCDLMGGICPPEYRGHCIDSHIYDIFERLAGLGHERRKYLREVIFEHMHYGVTLASYEGSGIEASHSEDQSLYLSLAEQRQQAALGMSQYIGSYHKEAISRPLPSVSIIMWLSGGLSQCAIACLEAVYEDNKFRQLDYEIVIVSSNSAEKSEVTSLSRGLRDKVSFTVCKDAGITEVLGKAATATNRDCLVFLDDRCLPRAGWLQALLETASDEEVGVVGSKWVNPRNGRIEHIGLSFLQDDDKMSGTHLYKGLPETNPVIDKTRDLQAVEMAGMLVKKACIRETDYRKESLIGWENLCICLDMKKTGKRIVYSPEASLFRYGQDISWGNSKSADIKNLPLELQEQLECDLEKQLCEDGFTLHRESTGYLICPDEKQVNNQTAINT